MDLIQIDIVGRQAPERSLDRQHDVFSRKAAIVRTGTHRKEDFGGDDHIVATCELAQRTSDNRLRKPDGVDIRGVKEIDAPFNRPLEERTGLFFVQYPGTPLFRAVGHGAEA